MNNKGISLWTAEMFGLTSMIILQYVVHVRDFKEMRSQYLPNIISEITRIGDENADSFVLFSDGYAGKTSFEFDYMIWKCSGKFTPDDFQKLLPVYNNSDLKKLNIDTQRIKILTIMNRDYEIERNIWYCPEIGLFRLFN